MNRSWIVTAAFGLVAGAPSAALAHGQYLEAVNNAVEAEYGGIACELTGTTCGLCHQPSAGDPELDIVVGFDDIETTIRDRAFYESLTGAGGWDHLLHMMDGNAHRDMNLEDLEDNVLPDMIAMDVDGDGDGVGDLEELSLGYNPIVAYEEGDPAATQLCGRAGRFPMVMGSTGSSGGAESTGGESSSGGSESPGSTGEPVGTSSESGPVDPTSDPTSGGTSTGSTTGGSGGETGASDDGGGGCRVGGSGYDGRLLGMLLMLGLVASRRRRQ